MPYNFDLPSSQRHANPPHSDPYSLPSEQDENVTWIPDEPCFNNTSSSETIDSRQPKRSSTGRVTEKPLSTVAALQHALRREGIGGKPLQREVQPGTSSVSQTRMVVKKPGGSLGVRPRDTLAANPHNSPARGYGKPKSSQRGGLVQSLPKFAQAVGDNVTNKSSYEFPDRDAHRQKRRKTEPLQNEVVGGHIALQRLVSDQGSTISTGTSRRPQYASDSLMGAQESRGVEELMQPRRLSTQSSVSIPVEQSSWFPAVGVGGGQPAICIPLPSQISQNKTVRKMTIARQVSDAEMIEDPMQHDCRPLPGGHPTLDEWVNAVSDNENSEGSFRKKKQDVVDLTSDPDPHESPPPTYNNTADSTRLHRNESIEFMGSKALDYTQKGPRMTSTSNPLSMMNVSTRLASHHFSKGRNIDTPKGRRRIVRDSADAEDVPEPQEVISIVDSQSQQLNGAATRSTAAFHVDLDDAIEADTDVSDAQGNSHPQSNMLAEITMYANMNENDDSVDELSRSETIKASQKPVKAAVRGHARRQDQSRQMELGTGDQLVNIVRTNGQKTSVPNSKNQQSVEDSDADELGPGSPPRAINAALPSHTSDIAPSKLRNGKKSTMRAAKPAPSASVEEDYNNMMCLAKTYQNMESVGLIFSAAKKLFQVRRNGSLLDDKEGIELSRIFTVYFGCPKSGCGKVRLKLRASSREEKSEIDVDFGDRPPAAHFVKFIRQQTVGVQFIAKEGEEMERMFMRGPVTQPRPSLAELEGRPVDQGLEIGLIQQNQSRSRAKDDLAIHEAAATPRRTLRDSMRTNEREKDAVKPQAQNPGRANPARNAHRSTYKEPSEEPLIVPALPKFSESPGLGERWDQPVVYPPTGRNKATVNFDDLKVLDEGDWLNDSIIEFQIRYLFDKYKPRDNQVFSFSTHFYSALTDSERGKNINYEKVRKWTAKDDIFSKDLVVVPVNEDLHWYLVVIVNLPHVDRRLEQPGDDGSGSPNEDHQPEEKPDGILAEKVEDVIPDTPEAQVNVTDEQAPAAPLSQAEQDIETIDRLSDKAADLKLESSRPGTATSEQAVPDISSIADAVVQEEAPKPAIPKARRSVGRTGPPVRKYADDSCVIFALDPLGGPRPKTIRNLKEYLIAEGKDKRGIELELASFEGKNAKNGIPQQSNFYDCGVYILAYIDKLMQDPAAFARKLLKQDFKEDQDWKGLDPNQMRADIRTVLMQIAKEQREERKRLKKLKKAAKKGAAAAAAVAVVPPSSQDQIRDAQEPFQDELSENKIPEIKSTVKTS